MSIKSIPINMVTSPNHWAPLKETFWTVTASMAVELWGQLVSVDALGTRPYVPAVGAILKVLFQRADYGGSVSNLNLSAEKTATLDQNFRALFKVNLSPQEALNATSGSLVFTLTEGTMVQKWVQNWAVKKLNTTPGF